MGNSNTQKKTDKELLHSFENTDNSIQKEQLFVALSVRNNPEYLERMLSDRKWDFWKLARDLMAKNERTLISEIVPAVMSAIEYAKNYCGKKITAENYYGNNNATGICEASETNSYLSEYLNT